MGIIKNNGYKLWKILERIISKTESIIGSGLVPIVVEAPMLFHGFLYIAM